MSKPTDIAALLVSIVALAVSGLGIYQTRSSLAMTKTSLEYAAASNKISQSSLDKVIEHNEKTLRPRLRWVYELSMGADKPGFVKIENVGEGVAHIVKVDAQFDGRAVLTEAKQLSALAKAYGIKGMSGFSLLENEYIAKQSTLTLFSIKAQALGPEVCLQDRLRREFADKLQIRVTYTSLYDYEQILLPMKPSQNSGCAGKLV